MVGLLRCCLLLQMAIVFHEGAVRDCEPPCVAQTFVPHDALLYKIFVVGSKHFVVERPSLKNFDAAGKKNNYGTRSCQINSVNLNSSKTRVKRNSIFFFETQLD